LPDFDFKKWDKLVKDIEDTNKRKESILEGKKIVEYQD